MRNGKGFVLRLLSKKEVYKMASKIRFDFVWDFYGLPLQKATSIISELTVAFLLLDIEKR